jgi:hypothetical protein
LRFCGFLLRFRHRRSLLGHPVLPGVPPPLPSAYRTRRAYPRTRGGPMAGFTRSTRVRPGPGRTLSLPRGRRCSLAIGSSVAAACRLATAGPCHPGKATQPGMLCLRGILKSSLIVALFRSFPSPVTAMAGTAALGLSRELRTRPIRNRPRTSRWGQVEHRPVATSSTCAEPPRRAHSPRATSCRNDHPQPAARRRHAHRRHSLRRRPRRHPARAHHQRPRPPGPAAAPASAPPAPPLAQGQAVARPVDRRFRHLTRRPHGTNTRPAQRPAPSPTTTRTEKAGNIGQRIRRTLNRRHPQMTDDHNCH